MGLSDISGHVIPAASGSGSSRAPVVAFRPVRERPSEIAQEFLVPCWASLLASTAVFTLLAYPGASNGLFPPIPDLNRAVADSLVVFCPDMVTAATPYLFVELTVNGTPVPGWSNIPIFPRAGVASVSFDTVIDLAPLAQIAVYAQNNDAVNAHFVGAYVHGWMWPKDYLEG